MQQPEVIWFPSSDGEHPCAGYLWQPQGEIRGVVQIVHGIAEHMGRYDHFARPEQNRERLHSKAP